MGSLIWAWVDGPIKPHYFMILQLFFSVSPLIILKCWILVFSTVVVGASAALFAILICSCVSCVLNAGLVRWYCLGSLPLRILDHKQGDRPLVSLPLVAAQGEGHTSLYLLPFKTYRSIIWRHFLNPYFIFHLLQQRRIQWPPPRPQQTLKTPIIHPKQHVTMKSTHWVCSGTRMLSPAERLNSCWFMLTFEEPSCGEQQDTAAFVRKRLRCRNLQEAFRCSTNHLPDPHVALLHGCFCLARSKNHHLKVTQEAFMRSRSPRRRFEHPNTLRCLNFFWINSWFLYIKLNWFNSIFCIL